MALSSTRKQKRVLFSTLPLLFFLIALSLSGCSMLASLSEEDPPSPSDPTVITLKLETSKDLNLNPEGGAAPVVARYYELKSSDGFSNADFFAIYDRDKDILGDDILFREELELTPDESREIKFEAKPESRFIGVFGAFRDLEIAQWRAVQEIPPDKSTVMRVRYSKNSVTIEVIEENPPSE